MDKKPTINDKISILLTKILKKKSYIIILFLITGILCCISSIYFGNKCKVAIDFIQQAKINQRNLLYLSSNSVPYLYDSYETLIQDCSKLLIKYLIFLLLTSTTCLASVFILIQQLKKH